MDIEKLIRLADLLDSKGERESAEEVDKLIRKAIGQDDLSEHEFGPSTSEAPTMTMQSTENDIKKAFDEFLKSPRRFENVHRLKRLIDEYVESSVESDADDDLPMMPKTEPYEFEYPERLMRAKPYEFPPMEEVPELVRSEFEYPTISSMRPAFKKLSEIADDLDAIGAKKEADMIDSFLNKYAIFELPESHGIGGLEDIDWGGDRPVFRSDEEEEEWEEEHEDERPFEKYKENAHKNMKDMLDEEELISPTEEEAEEEEMGSPGSIEPGKLHRGYMKNKLSKRADDYNEGRVEEGDTDQSKRYDSKYHHSLQIREPKRDQERVDREGRKEHHVETYKKTDAHHLSTRYCPEHIGDQMARIGDGVYQCPRDGHIYNWETGWTDFDGNHHPGGSVAAQTPDSTGYAIPHRIFDSREKVLNVVN